MKLTAIPMLASQERNKVLALSWRRVRFSFSTIIEPNGWSKCPIRNLYPHSAINMGYWFFYHAQRLMLSTKVYATPCKHGEKEKPILPRRAFVLAKWA
jgi:hypothetical protein